jgi:tripartite ATP-independent transporter DctM subunit
MFILLGEILLVSGLSKRIYNSVTPLLHFIPGRLMHTNIVVCTLFGAVSGSSTATAAAVGSVAYPELTRRGYDRRAVTGALAAGGTLGLLIPPSLSLLIYGAWQEVSVGRLFLAGVLPGLMLTALFMGFIAYQALRRPELMPPRDERPSLGVILVHLLQIWPLVVLVGAVLGSIYAGLATPTESAGLGVLAAILMGIAFGELTLAQLWRAARQTVGSLGAIFLILIGAVVLGQSISIIGLPRQLIEAVSAIGLGPNQVLFLVTVMYVLLGCIFDGLSLMLITVPFLYPMMMTLGFDPVWFGVYVTVMIEIGMITPPVGVNLFVLVAIARGDISLAEAARAAVPYWVLMLFGALLLTLFPQIALYLPRLVYQ